MRRIIKKYLFSRRVAFIHDLFWVPTALILAYLLRFNLESIPAIHYPGLYLLLALAIPIQGVACWLFGLYHGFWRFASIPDLIKILKAVAAGTIFLIGCCWLLTKLEGVPRSVFVIYPLFLTGGLCGPRILYRWFRDHRLAFKQKPGERTIVVGAGRAGEMLVRDLCHQDGYETVAFLDDDRKLLDREIHGVRVVGNTGKLAEIVADLDIELVVLAMPSAGREVMENLVNICRESGVRCLTLPSLEEMRGMEVDSGRLREVSLADLLGREVIKLDKQAINDYISGRVVMVTGGGGSIGSELCRQLAGVNPSRLIIFDHGEYNLYAIDMELRKSFQELSFETILGDVKDIERVEWVFSTFKPAVVFHAAAYKHVPMLEINPAEGVRNNVHGSRCVADAADRHGTEKFVLVSTDKAVNPANVMGASKRVAELYCQNLDPRSTTSFITTRFGNVLGSAGSVVPLFKKQVAGGGPVTVTHEKISRYFMTIPESVSLILQAGAMGGGGEIFVLDMGEPVLIKDLAEKIIRLSGLEPGRDIKIVYTGLRPGEKLYEELFHETENLQPTDHEKLLLASSREVDWDWLNKKMEFLRIAAVGRDVDKLRECLQGIVPEFKKD
jgi:FlaA1/EpsC-like NDP-sugar epimerase